VSVVWRAAGEHRAPGRRRARRGHRVAGLDSGVGPGAVSGPGLRQWCCLAPCCVAKRGKREHACLLGAGYGRLKKASMEQAAVVPRMVEAREEKRNGDARRSQQTA
jgi:hypothetical protein